MTASASKPRRQRLATVAADVIGDAQDPSPVDIQQVPLRSISLTDDNPRQHLELDELLASIKAHGLLQPLVVRRIGRRFELIAGHRRFEALRQLGWTQIPVVVRAADRDEASVLRLVENLQRRDLRPTEEAAALEALVRAHGWSTRQVAEVIQRSQAYVSKRLRVFEDPLLAPAVLADQLSVSAAEELLTLDDRTRYELLEQAIAQHWDRQQVRAAAGGRFAANRHVRPRGFTRQVKQLRLSLRDVAADQLTEADRRELRMLFDELALLARAPRERRARVFPALEVAMQVAGRRQHRT
jgi:ParB/RepB/Spo0J family partition protein